jgi:predicted TIM-barrel fold metal-dependent hydrolase
MVAEMDYAGVGTVVLQNDHIYGHLAEYFAEAARRWPGRFIGLAQVDEPFGYRDEELRGLEDQVTRLGMRGLYFTMTAFFRNGYRILPDALEFDPLWRLVARRNLPVFWVHSASSPAGDYGDEMRRLRRIVDRHPAIRHVLVHGVPTGLYADAADRIAWPSEVVDVIEGGPVWTEALYPIAWGGRMPYPYARAQAHFRQTYDRFGSEKLLWGSDMPNVGRYCTYRQALAYLWDHADFLSPEDRRRIFRDNTLGLLAGGARAIDGG